jgi:hypothetical protein
MAITALHDYKVHGTWEVTTEGDEEGRSTRHLGTHTGYLDDIAFKLADRCYYSLQFKRVDPKILEDEGEKRGDVMISFASEAGLNSLKPMERAVAVHNLLMFRDVLVEEGNYYGSVRLIRGKSPEGQAKAEEARKIVAAMGKLTKEELELILKANAR